METHSCPVCGAQVPADVAMIAATTHFRMSKGRRRWLSIRRALLCAECARGGGSVVSEDGTVTAYPPLEDALTDPVPCQVCGTLVRLPRDPRRKLHVCSDGCRGAHYRTQRATPVSTDVTRVCAACGEDLPAGRQDRRYCSDACRQRAYRHRVTA